MHTVHRTLVVDDNTEAADMTAEYLRFLGLISVWRTEV